MLSPRLARTVAIAGLTIALFVPAGAVIAGPPPCTAGAPGCKTADDPDKNNPKFTETQRGRVGAPGTSETCFGTNPGGQIKDC